MLELCTDGDQFYHRRAPLGVLAVHRARRFHAALTELTELTGVTEDIVPTGRKAPVRREYLRPMTCSELAAGQYHGESTTEDSECSEQRYDQKCDDDESEEDGLLQQVYVLDDASERPPEVPLFCVAERHTIRTLMASTIYSRAVWKIHDPIVGVSFHPLSYAVQLVVGWCEPCDGPITNQTLVSVASACHLLPSTEQLHSLSRTSVPFWQLVVAMTCPACTTFATPWRPSVLPPPWRH